MALPERDSGPSLGSTASAELVFPPQYPFSWTLRGAPARRVQARTPAGVTRYHISGSARDAHEVAAVVAFCAEHHAKLELHESVG